MGVHSYDLINTVVLVVLLIMLGMTYGLRVMRSGRAHFERVDKQGGSVFLSKSLMEMAYWGMQPMARILIYCKITPNAISWASFFFGLVAGACLAFGHFGFAGVFAGFSGVLDSLDGMVARLTRKSSDAGEVLDAAVDRYAEFFFLGGLVLYYREIIILQLLALIALLGCFMVSYSTAKAEALQVDPPKSSMRRPERALYLTLGAILSPVSISTLEVASYSEGKPYAYPMVLAMGLVGIVSNFSAAERFIVLARKIREQEKKLGEVSQSGISEINPEESSQHILSAR